MDNYTTVISQAQDKLQPDIYDIDNYTTVISQAQDKLQPDNYDIDNYTTVISRRVTVAFKSGFPPKLRTRFALCHYHCVLLNRFCVWLLFLSTSSVTVVVSLKSCDSGCQSEKM